MLKTCAKLLRAAANNSKLACRLCHGHTAAAASVPATQPPSKKPLDLIDTRALPGDDSIDFKIEKTSPLDKCAEDVSHVAPYLRPSFNFAAYINNSETLQQLLRLGVNLYKVEQKKEAAPYVLGLDFERDVKGHLLFLHDLGAEGEDIAAFITKNPFVFKEDLEDLRVRINYLQSKKFNEEAILRIVTRNPFWLMYSTQDIDARLGFFQKEFSLVGDEVRALAVRQPKLITYSIRHVKLNLFSMKEEMGFAEEEIKSILLNKPKLFMKDHTKILKTFEYVHNVMKIPLEMIAKMPGVLSCRESRLKQRHLFLEALGRAQYDPKEPNYVSILTLVSHDDGEFSVNTAKSSLQAYNVFLKSL